MREEIIMKNEEPLVRCSQLMRKAFPLFTNGKGQGIVSVLLFFLLFFCSLSVKAQGNIPEPELPTQYVEIKEEKPKIPFFQGFTLSADVVGVAQYFLSDYGSVEAALRLNLKNTFFPIVEMGLADCDITDENTSIRYKTRAPYARVGIDFNMLKNKLQDNRLYVGARYGISNYKFDISGPAIKDPFWGGSEPFSYRDISATSHWAEAVLGVQVKMWGHFHMGWAIRYRHEISSTKNKYAKPYYIPGYGTTAEGGALGITYSLIFDLNWGMKKVKKASPPAPLQKARGGE